jgi:hypothetical protein
MIKIKNVSPANIFMYQNKKAIVIDIAEVKSLLTGEVIEYKCYARMIEGYATNNFEIPFSTVAKNRIK